MQVAVLVPNNKIQSKIIFVFSRICFRFPHHRATRHAALQSASFWSLSILQETKLKCLYLGPKIFHDPSQSCFPSSFCLFSASWYVMNRHTTNIHVPMLRPLVSLHHSTDMSPSLWHSLWVLLLFLRWLRAFPMKFLCVYHYYNAQR